MAQDPAIIVPIMNMMLALLFPPISPAGWRMFTAEIYMKCSVQVAVLCTALQSESVTDNLVEERDYFVWVI